MSSLDPLRSILTSCSRVTDEAQSVSIDGSGIDAFVEGMKAEDLEALRNGVEWDAEEWHYCGDVANGGPLTCQYVFVMDALNFCFWPTPDLEYDTLALSLKRVLEQDSTAFDADKLAKIDAKTLNSWFPDDKHLPNVDERVIRLQELGEALTCEGNRFGGLAMNMVKSANNSAQQLVRLLLQYIPGFRDTSIYNGRLVHLYKRVQILVGDVWAAYGRQTTPGSSGRSVFCFTDIAQLTMFADYRVPQLLRELGIMKYSESLATKIDGYEEIACGSKEEVEIRAVTVIAVDRLQKALVKRGIPLLAIEVDWLLWQRGEAMKDQIKPHHRTLTIFY